MLRALVRHSLLDRWGRWVYHQRHRTLAVSAVFLVLSIAVLARGGALSTGTIHGVEADVGVTLIERELHPPDAQGFTIIFGHPTLTVDDEAFQRAVREAVAGLRRHPDVRSVRTPFDPDVSTTMASTMFSVDTHHCIAQVGVTPAAAVDTRRFPSIRGAIRSTALSTRIAGVAVFRADLDATLQRDLVRAEALSMPVTVAVLLIVFGSLLAALLPVGVGGLAVVGGVACVLLLSRRMEVAQYAINVGSLIGTGVAIDYSLFVVNRFREELAAGNDVPSALGRSLATAGRAVAFSGLAVAVGLSGLLFFRGSYMASLGLGGTVVVLLSVIYALTFLPALLGVLGTRVNRGGSARAKGDPDAVWRRIATTVMKRPVLVLVPTLALLLAAGRPFFDLKISIPDVSVLPAHTDARKGLAALEEHFPERAATRITVVAHFRGDPFATPARVGALYDLSRRIGAVPGVDHVEGIFDVDGFLDRDGHISTLTKPRDTWGEVQRDVARETVGRSIVVMSALTEHRPASDEARAIVRAIRRSHRVADGELLVTGPTAMDLDSARYLRERAPTAIAYVVAMTALILFLLLGSVVLPLKAVAMNMLSITASFGALVWIFQKGHLRGLLGFTPGPVEPSLPIVMFCAVFGLSMDYEVLLLTRMQEEYVRTGNNERAVAEGLARSARLITSAAAIMVVVFAAFSMAELVLLKAIGFGMAIAVALDATLVRVLVVPATMRLFGDLNWWAPAVLTKLWRKLPLGGDH
jgi:putative drug exporter of the RND superfamily